MALLFGCVFVFSEAADGAVISSIQTAGNRGITTAQILSKVRSRAGEAFDKSTVAEDAKRIAELKGVEYSYYNKVVVDGKVELTFVIVERNIVRSIGFAGHRKYRGSTLLSKLGFKVGDYLDPIAVESGRVALLEFYHKKGYALVEVVLDNTKINEGKLVYIVKEGQRVRIRSLRFIGNKSIKTKALKKAVKSKSRKFFVVPIYYEEKNITRDLTKLQGIYYERGYLDADIQVAKRFRPDKKKVDLTFEIKEGPVYKVREIVIADNKYFDEKALREELKLEEGSVFSKDRAEQDAKRLRRRYNEEGFIAAMVSRDIKFVPDNKVDVKFSIKENKRFRIGRINVLGNEQTQDKVIRRVLDEYDFKPGNWYNSDMARGNGEGYLEKLVRRAVLAKSVAIIPTGDMLDQRDAQVSLVEGQTGMVMLGAGVASDSGVMGQLVFEQKNFDISDHPDNFKEFITGRAYKGAGQNFRIALQPGTEVSTYSVDFTDNYFQDRPIALNLSGSSYERDQESYNEQRTKGYVGFTKRYKSRWRRSIGFRAENINAGSLDLDAPKEIVDDKGDNFITGIRFGIGKDTTDNMFNPSAGYTFNANYEQVVGDHTFGVVSWNYIQFKTLREDLAERKTILGTKISTSSIVGNAPSFEKFYAGGQGSIRGFDYRGVSTRGWQRNVASPQQKDPIGSDWLFLASAEVTTPLVGDTISSLFFIDSAAIDTGGYRASAGVGIQIMIPQWFGPVPMRFELAAPIRKDDNDETQVFSFSVGRLF